MTREIAPAILGMDLDDQAALDARLIALDGTPNKSRLGANAVLGVSLAVAHAAAAARGEELFVHLNRLWRDQLDAPGRESAPLEPALPLPMVNMISGGLHAGGNLDIQDVLIIPVGARSYSEALEMTVALYRAVGAVLKEARLRVGPGRRRGGLRTAASQQRTGVRDRRRCHARLRLRARPRRGDRRRRGFDPLLSTRLAEPTACAPAATVRSTASGMIDLLAGWVERYPIISIEDGLAEDDWDGWTALTERLGASVQLIGDDLFATQVARLRQGIDRRAGNAVLIKLNQVGTLSETFDALRLAHGPRLPHGRLGPLGRDRGHDDRRPGRRHRRRPDQDRLGGALGAAGQVQPPAADRGGSGPGRTFRRTFGTVIRQHRRLSSRATPAEYDRASGEYSQRSSGSSVLFWWKSLGPVVLPDSWDGKVRSRCVHHHSGTRVEEVVHEDSHCR